MFVLTYCLWFLCLSLCTYPVQAAHCNIEPTMRMMTSCQLKAQDEPNEEKELTRSTCTQKDAEMLFDLCCGIYNDNKYQKEAWMGPN